MSWLAAVCPALLCCALLLAPGLLRADVAALLDATVTRVIDGDTLDVKLDSGPLRVRLYSIDAPETNQPGGKQARLALSELVQGKRVQLQPIEQDRYDRLVATVFVHEMDVNRELVRRGHAWAYRRYMSRSAPGYCSEEALARARRLGLWQSSTGTNQDEPRRGHAEMEAWGNQAIAPWEWRQRKRLEAPTNYSQETLAQCVAAIGRR